MSQAPVSWDQLIEDVDVVQLPVADIKKSWHVAIQIVHRVNFTAALIGRDGAQGKERQAQDRWS